MVEGGQTERIRKMLDTFGIDDPATDRKTFEQILRDESPIWIDVVSQLGITPQ
jgi:hypothetical protein